MTETLYGNGYFALADLEPYYSRHVSAMTTEGLRHKSSIAGELAVRDRMIAELDAAKRAAHSTIATLLESLARAEKERDQLGSMCAAYEEKFKMQREIVCAAQDWRKVDRTTDAPHALLRLLDALAAAVDALDEWEKERAAELAGGSFTCPTCGPRVKADEDGCCATCGEDCKMEGA